MPEVVGLIVAGITGLAAGSAAVVGISAVVTIGLTIGLGFAARALTPKPRLGDFRTRGTTVMVRDSAAPQRVIYGETVVSGPLVLARSPRVNDGSV